MCGQVYAHFAHVALRQGHSRVTLHRNLSTAEVPAAAGVEGARRCVIGAMFSGGAAGAVVVALNMCPTSVRVEWWPLASGGVLSSTAYPGFAEDNPLSDWTPASAISGLDAPPWSGGPLKPLRGLAGPTPTELVGISLTLVHHRPEHT